MKKIIIFNILLLFSCINLFPATMFDPDLNWKIIETENFRIHYHQGLGKIALKMSIITEKIHISLTGEIGWKPKSKTDVVLVDNSDLANGFATPFPYNKIQIYVTRPGLNSVLNNFDDWLELVFRHEYTHILNLDSVSGFPSGTRIFPGRVCFPNMFLPVWAIEGNAVYQESKYSSFGRNNSTYTDMIMRTEAGSGNLKSISKASHFPREWPAGNVPYLYGGLFFNYLSLKYGSGSISNYFHENSDNIIPFSDSIYPIPYFFNKDARDVYGKSFAALWDEWEKFIIKKYTLQRDRIKNSGITKYIKISNTGNNSIFPRFSVNKKFIYYIETPLDSYNKLIKFDLNNKKRETLAKVNRPNSVAVSRNEEIIISDIEVYNNFSLYYDAHRYKDGYGKITNGLRAKQIDVSIDGRRLVYVSSKLNRYSLIVSDREFKKQTPFIKNSALQIASPRISPDGKFITFVMRSRKGFSDLILLDIEKNKYFQLTNDRFNDIEPAWHPNNKKIIFSSDRTGVYNLFEYSLGTGEISQVTNLLGGGFSPDVSRDGRMIVFSSYHTDGKVISIMEYPKDYLNKTKTGIKKLKPDFFKTKNTGDKTGIIEKKLNELNKKKYTPFKSAIPSFIIPILGSSEYYNNKMDTAVGFYTLGWDTLLRHNYSIMAYSFIEQKRALVDLLYTYSRYYPNFSIGYYDDTLMWGKDEFPWEGKNTEILRRELTRLGYIAIQLPFMTFYRRQSFQLSYIYEKKYVDYYRPGYSQLEIEYNLPHIQLSYLFNNSIEYLFSISREDGRIFTIILDGYQKSIGSGRNFFKGKADYREYMPFFFTNNVIMVNLRGGVFVNRPEYLAPFSLGKFKNGEMVEFFDGSSNMGVRGYPSGTVNGDKISALTIEYRFPIFQADAGVYTIPAMFRDLWLKAFFDYGNVWNGKPDIKEFKYSAGAELHLKLTMGYRLDISGYIGYAKGFKKYGETQYYFGFSSNIESLTGTNKRRIKHKPFYL